MKMTARTSAKESLDRERERERAEEEEERRNFLVTSHARRRRDKMGNERSESQPAGHDSRLTVSNTTYKECVTLVKRRSF